MMPRLSAGDMCGSFGMKSFDRLRNPSAILKCVVFATATPGLPSYNLEVPDSVRRMKTLVY